MLERWLASQLATYLLIGPQDTRVSLTGREIVVSGASLKTEPLNALLEASPLLVAAGQISSLKIKLRPLTASAIHIELNGLQLSLEPRGPHRNVTCGDLVFLESFEISDRSLNSPWWKDISRNRQQSAEQIREAQLAFLDPKGSSAHAFAESGLKQAAATLVTRITSAVLSALKVDVHSVDIRVQVVSPDGSTKAICLHLDQLTLEEGCAPEAGQQGGLLGAAAAALFGSASSSVGEVTKRCQLVGWCCWLDTSEAPPVQAENWEEVENSSSGERGSGKWQRYLLLPHSLELVLHLKHTVLQGVEVAMDGMELEVEGKDLTALLDIGATVTGPIQAAVAEDGMQGPKLTARENWARAYRTVCSRNSRCSMKAAMAAARGRQRYAGLYDEWLRAQGWGSGMEGAPESGVGGKRKRISSSEMKAQLKEAERDLPLEAVMLARRVARQRVEGEGSGALLESQNRFRFSFSVKRILCTLAGGVEQAVDPESIEEGEEGSESEGKEERLRSALCVACNGIVAGGDMGAERNFLEVTWECVEASFLNVTHPPPSLEEEEASSQLTSKHQRWVALPASADTMLVSHPAINASEKRSSSVEEGATTLQQLWGGKWDPWAFLKNAQGALRTALSGPFDGDGNAAGGSEGDDDDYQSVGSGDGDVEFPVSDSGEPFCTLLLQTTGRNLSGEREVKCTVSVGRLDLNLRPDQVQKAASLLQDLPSLGTPSASPPHSAVIEDAANEVCGDRVSLGEVVSVAATSVMTSVRKLVLGITPSVACILTCSMEGPRVTLAAPLLTPGKTSGKTPGKTPGKARKRQEVVLDLGTWRVDSHPLHAPPEMGRASKESEWGEVVDSSVWERRAEVPSHKGAYSEQHQVWNHFGVNVNGVTLQVGQGIEIESLLEPLSLAAHLSMHRAVAGSLVDTAVAISVASMVQCQGVEVRLAPGAIRTAAQTIGAFLSALPSTPAPTPSPSLSQVEPTPVAPPSPVRVRTEASCSFALGCRLPSIRFIVPPTPLAPPPPLLHSGLSGRTTSADLTARWHHDAPAGGETGKGGEEGGQICVHIENLLLDVFGGDNFKAELRSGVGSLRVEMGGEKGSSNRLFLQGLSCHILGPHTALRTAPTSPIQEGDKGFNMSAREQVQEWEAVHVWGFSPPSARFWSPEGGGDGGGGECQRWVAAALQMGRVLVSGGALGGMDQEVSQLMTGPEEARVVLHVESELEEVAVDWTGGLVLVDTAAMAQMLRLSHVCHLAIEPLTQVAVGSKRQQGVPAGGPSVGQEERLPWEGRLVVKLGGLSAVVAKSEDAPEPAQGFLLEADTGVELRVTGGHTDLDFTLSRSLVHCARWQKPQFGPSLLSSSLPGSDSQAGGRSASLAEVEGDGEESSWADTPLEERSIVSRLTLNCALASFETQEAGRVQEWGGGWQGKVNVAGVDVAISTAEIELLLALAIPFSAATPASTPLKSEPEPEPEPYPTITPPVPSPTTTPFLPNGCIVTIKDTVERSFLAVEELPGETARWHLVCVPHYSLAGDRCLFKMGYPNQERDPDWLCLTSLHAKNEEGQALRLEHVSKTSLIQLASPSEGWLEQWRVEAVVREEEGAEEGEEGEGEVSISLYDCKPGRRHHMVNRKSGRGLAVVELQPTGVKGKGNPLKIQLMALPRGEGEGEEAETEALAAACVPGISVEVAPVVLRLVYEAAGGAHTLPLLQARVEMRSALLQIGPNKTRFLCETSVGVEYYESSSSGWASMLKSSSIELSYRLRSQHKASDTEGFPKAPITTYVNCTKIEMEVTEEAMDTLLFLCGVLDLAGPYNVKFSPLAVNRCQVLNSSGLEVLCQFDRVGPQQVGTIAPRQTQPFLIRHNSSRRDATPARTTSRAVVRWRGPMGRASSPIVLSLGDPGAVAVRTRLCSVGSGKEGPGPMMVIHVSKQSEEGIRVTVAPLLVVRNNSGMPLELKLRRPPPNSNEATVLQLEEGGVVDDALVAFESQDATGDRRKIISGLAIGHYLLSLRPASPATDPSLDWSPDVSEGAAVKVAGWMEAIQRNFRRSMGEVFGRGFHSSFSSLVCNPVGDDSQQPPRHFLLCSTVREVAIGGTERVGKAQRLVVRQGGGWMTQRELVFLPTLRIRNLLTSDIYVALGAAPGEIWRPSATAEWQGRAKSCASEAIVSGGGKVTCLHADPRQNHIVLHDPLRRLTSPPVSLVDARAAPVKDMEVVLGEGEHAVRVSCIRGTDGVLTLTLYANHTLCNATPHLLLCSPAVMRGTGRRRKIEEHEGRSIRIPAGARVPWLSSSRGRSTSLVLVRRTDPSSKPAVLDLESLAGATEVGLQRNQGEGTQDLLVVGVRLVLPSSDNPSRVVELSPRYQVVNGWRETIQVCHDKLQSDSSSWLTIVSGQRMAFHSPLPTADTCHSDPPTLRFRPVSGGQWSWSSPVSAASLGSFSLRVRSPQSTTFGVAEVVEEGQSLVLKISAQEAARVPYRLENGSGDTAIAFCQKGVEEWEKLEGGGSAGFVWADTRLPRKILLSVLGPQLSAEVNPDKLKSWRALRPKRNPFLRFDLTAFGRGEEEGSGGPSGYEVYADGLTRVVRVCSKDQARGNTKRVGGAREPLMEADIRVGLVALSLLMPAKQEGGRPETLLYGRVGRSWVEYDSSVDSISYHLKLQRVDVDAKWSGAPWAGLLQPQGERAAGDRPLLEGALVALQVKVDEDTLMKLVPYARTRVGPCAAPPSPPIYFEQFEIHPIKIVASFSPSTTASDYSSSQEALRGLLHSVIKVPEVKGTVVELNGVHLTHALLSYTQLALKCAQHYSWYAMRAVYLARGSELLPPGFASLFDDSAASALDVFFDPSNGSINAQNLTRGMFNLLKQGLKRRGPGGSAGRYLGGELEKSMREAGSNLAYAAVTQLSDSVVQGVDTYGLDGIVRGHTLRSQSEERLKGGLGLGLGLVGGQVYGLRRGILKVALQPSLLRSAVVGGRGMKRIKLDRSLGTEEMYVEGYLQALLDALYKQDYLRVKVTDDEVVLKNLPPNTQLSAEVVATVRGFLVGEGLVAGQTSAQGTGTLRRLKGEPDKQVGPAVRALCEQLGVLLMVKEMRKQLFKLPHVGKVIGVQPKVETLPPPEEKRGGGGGRPGRGVVGNVRVGVSHLLLSSALAYLDGRLCRQIPQPFVRRIVSGFLLSFLEP